MSRYCLDTSAYSHFMRGDHAAAAVIDRAEWLGLPAVALGELRVGFLLGGRRQQNEEKLLELLAAPVVEVVEVDDEVSRHYSEIVVELRRAGRPIPTNDIWIAASAVRAGALLLTYDEHFAAIGRLGMIRLGES
jgi:predicted nucleic acid-binding protein